MPLRPQSCISLCPLYTFSHNCLSVLVRSQDNMTKMRSGDENAALIVNKDINMKNLEFRPTGNKNGLSKNWSRLYQP